MLSPSKVKQKELNRRTKWHMLPEFYRNLNMIELINEKISLSIKKLTFFQIFGQQQIYCCFANLKKVSKELQ